MSEDPEKDSENVTSKKTYRLDIICSNCFHEQTLEIPFGSEWNDPGWGIGSGYEEHGSWIGGYFKEVKCENCGCPTLRRKEKK